MSYKTVQSTCMCILRTRNTSVSVSVAGHVVLSNVVVVVALKERRPAPGKFVTPSAGLFPPSASSLLTRDMSEHPLFLYQGIAPDAPRTLALNAVRQTATADAGFYSPVHHLTQPRSSCTILSPPIAKGKRWTPSYLRASNAPLNDHTPTPGPGTHSPAMHRMGAPSEMVKSTQPQQSPQSSRRTKGSESWIRRPDGLLVPPASMAQGAGHPMRPIFASRESAMVERRELLARQRMYGDDLRPLTSGDCLYGGPPSRYPSRTPPHPDVGLWWHLPRGSDLRGPSFEAMQRSAAAVDLRYRGGS